MLPFDAILFDLGNTLLYFDGEWHETLSEAGKALMQCLELNGIHLSRYPFFLDLLTAIEERHSLREIEFKEKTMAELLTHLLTDYGFDQVHPNTIQQCLKRFYAVTQRNWVPDAETLPLIQNLYSQGYQMGVVSNASDDEDVQFLVDKAEIRPYMKFILSSASCGVRKPDPAIFTSAINRLDLKDHPRVAMVGDTLHADIMGANNAGLFSIWITQRADREENWNYIAKIKPDATVANLGEIPELLKTLTR